MPFTFSSSSIPWTGIWIWCWCTSFICVNKNMPSGRGSQPRVVFASPEDIGRVQRGFELSQWRRGCYWGLASRDQGRYWTSYKSGGQLPTPPCLLYHSISTLCADGIFPFKDALCTQLSDCLVHVSLPTEELLICKINIQFPAWQRRVSLPLDRQCSPRLPLHLL